MAREKDKKLIERVGDEGSLLDKVSKYTKELTGEDRDEEKDEEKKRRAENEARRRDNLDGEYSVPKSPLVMNPDKPGDKPSYWEDGTSMSRAAKASKSDQESRTDTTARETTEGRRQERGESVSEANEISTGGRDGRSESESSREENSSGRRTGSSVTRKGPKDDATTAEWEKEFKTLLDQVKAYKIADKEERKKRTEGEKTWLNEHEADLDRRELAERLGHAITQLGAGMHGLKSGTDMSALVFDKKDFGKDRDRLMDRFKTQLANIEAEEAGDREERRFASTAGTATANLLGNRIGDRQRLNADSTAVTTNDETSSNNSTATGREKARTQESTMGFTQRKGKENRVSDEMSTSDSQRVGTENRKATERSLMNSEESTRTRKEGDRPARSVGSNSISPEEWERRERFKADLATKKQITAADIAAAKEDKKEVGRIVMKLQAKDSALKEPGLLVSQMGEIAVGMGADPTKVAEAIEEEKHWLRGGRGDAAAASQAILKLIPKDTVGVIARGGNPQAAAPAAAGGEMERLDPNTGKVAIFDADTKAFKRWK